MKFSSISGIIKRRILVNYRIKPEMIQPLLPAKFHPKLHNDFAIAGICLIRLEQLHHKNLPAFTGTSSENAAHRIAVLWDENGETKEGVYVFRRDTDSFINQLAGGRLFPGEYHHAKFNVKDDGDHVDFGMTGKHDDATIQVRGRTMHELPAFSGFDDMAAASIFFEGGSLGYSATQKGDRLEAMRLKTSTWKIAPLHVDHIYSGFFDDKKRFPEGSVSFDCALVMRDIPHEWQSEDDLHL